MRGEIEDRNLCCAFTPRVVVARFLLAAASRCLRATSIVAHCSDVPHPASLAATGTDRAPTASRTASCHHRSTHSSFTRSPRRPPEDEPIAGEDILLQRGLHQRGQPIHARRRSVTAAASEMRVAGGQTHHARRARQSRTIRRAVASGTPQIRTLARANMTSMHGCAAGAECSGVGVCTYVPATRSLRSRNRRLPPEILVRLAAPGRPDRVHRTSPPGTRAAI